MQHTNTSSMSCASTMSLLYRDLGARGSARLSSKMDKEESAGEGLFSLKPVGCFWKAFFLVDFGNPRLMQKKIRPNAYSKKRSTRVLARGWEMQGRGLSCVTQPKVRDAHLQYDSRI